MHTSVLKQVFRRNFRPMASVAMYEGPEFSMEDCKNHLSQFCGGSFDLQIDDSCGIATLVINHLAKKNAITGSMMVQFEEVVCTLEKWINGKGLLLYGAEGNFCSGGDLNFAQKTSSPEGGYKMATFMQNVLSRLQKIPLISVAFIDGYALGGGAELAISCDFRLFSKNASLGFVHAKMGIMPAWGGMTMAIQTLGYKTALDLVSTARLVRTPEAQNIGLCDAVVDSAEEAKAWLSERVKWDVSATRAIKAVAANVRNSHLTEEHIWDYEKKVFSPLWGGPANQQALQSKVKHK
ncbi:ethylmalonyl-CoA decarboxylase-like [Macrosteles quadrilineatus]|uniref:ethylmalonyl-CoA decarboxylase-like n=1 Tax=Macrosteles quadrilineatus TaxID=74068 RepID=UPI0023E17B41|nr:ethylmalonyl-CoA decarboxylase-like [Macrosteles quadrilineatus]